LIQRLEVQSSILINKLKKEEEILQDSFKNTRNINHKETEKHLVNLSREITSTLNYGQSIDDKLSSNHFNIVEYLLKINSSLENQHSTEPFKTKNSTFTSMSNCIQNLRNKFIMGRFSDSPSFSVTSLFELFFDFIPQDAKTFFSLRQTSREVESIVFERWTCAMNSIPFKIILNCKNITKVSLELEKDKTYEEFLSKYFNSFKIKDCTLLLKPCMDLRDNNELIDFIEKQKTLESLTLISANRFNLNHIGSLVSSGIKTLKFAVSRFSNDNDQTEEEFFFQTKKFQNSTLENLILFQCNAIFLDNLNVSNMKKLYTDIPIRFHSPFQFQFPYVNGKDFSSVEALEDYRREAQTIIEDDQNIIKHELTYELWCYRDIDHENMENYFQELKLLGNNERQPKKKKY
jgi:hypothetical protein